MGEIAKVILAAAGGTLLGAYVEPKITLHLGSIATNPATGKFVHAGIAGLTAGGVYWVIRKVA